MSMTMSSDVDTHGPVFDSRGPMYMTRGADEGSKEVAQYVQRQVVGVLESRMQHPTGHYVSTIDVVREGTGWKVDGEGTAYGRWLEGTGSMNFPATRFRGYRAFRTVTQRVRTRAAAIAWPAIRPWIRRLGGR
jgi:hypothetical protein